MRLEFIRSGVLDVSFLTTIAALTMVSYNLSQDNFKYEELTLVCSKVA